MAQVGYARVSSVGQSLDVQLNKIKYCDKVFLRRKRAGPQANALGLRIAWNMSGKAIRWWSRDSTDWPAPPCICVRLPRNSNVSESTCRCSTSISIPAMPPADCSSTCSAPVLSFKRKSELIAKWMGCRKRRNAAFASAQSKT